MDQVNGGKLEESKKGAVIREGKGGGLQPTSGGNAKKRLKPKKLVGKLHSTENPGEASSGQTMSITGQQQQQFQFQNNAHLSIHGHLPGAGQAAHVGVCLPMVSKNNTNH